MEQSNFDSKGHYYEKFKTRQSSTDHLEDRQKPKRTRKILSTSTEFLNGEPIQ
jgi:hypothetical protein